MLFFVRLGRKNDRCRRIFSTVFHFQRRNTPKFPHFNYNIVFHAPQGHFRPFSAKRSSILRIAARQDCAAALPFLRASFRDGRFAPLKIAASGARALLAMTNLVGFAEKRNVDSARKRLHPAKNVCFSNITVSNLCHCEEHSDVAILKPKVWHPMARHGGRNRQNPKIFDPSRRDSTMALPRKRHFTRTQVRISHAQHISLAHRANFTARPCRASFRDAALRR